MHKITIKLLNKLKLSVVFSDICCKDKYKLITVRKRRNRPWTSSNIYCRNAFHP